MAVTSTFTRLTNSYEVPLFEEVCSCTLAGTYATGGFTWNPLTIAGSKGSSPLPASRAYTADFYGANGYNYQTTFNAAGTVATTLIFTSGGAQLANTTAVPDTALTVLILKGR